MSRGARDLVGMLALVVMVCGVPGSARAEVAARSLTMAVVGTPGTIATGASQFSIGGDTAVKVTVPTISGGKATVVDGPDSSTRALQFPPYVSSGTYPRAVVGVTPTTGDALSPGDSDFEYGAVFRVNTTSSTRSIDNGDNLFQRGLYNDPSQFKLQLDHGYPSCRVRGSGGQVFVSSPSKVTSGAWYRVTCSRIGSKVTVQWAPYGSTAAPVTATATGSSGTLSFPATTPASIGGKLNPSGTIVSSSTDQFNGAVANVWINAVPATPPPNQAPQAHATAFCTDLDCSFDASDSTDADGDPLTYDWDFGDGSDPGSGATTTHSYPAGTRTVTLTVADDHGNSDTDTVEATTTDPVDPGDPVDQPPIAHAAATCLGLDCSFSALDSTDPENDPLTFSWDFGDGSDPGSGATTTHSYAAGTRTVTLTVSDDHGNSASDTVEVTTTAPATPVAFVAAAATNGNRTSHTVTVPAGVRAGDALLLFFAANSPTPTYTNPAGWTVLQSRNGDGTVVRAYSKVATAGDAGSVVRLTSSAYVKSDLSVVAYRNTSAGNPVASSVSKVDNVTGASHTSPAVTAVGAGSWLVTYWADESTSTTAWTAPAGQSVRAKTFGSSSGHISGLLADSNGPVAAGATGLKTAVANSVSTRGVSVSVLLAPTAPG